VPLVILDLLDVMDLLDWTAFPQKLEPLEPLDIQDLLEKQVLLVSQGLLEPQDQPVILGQLVLLELLEQLV